MQNISTEASGKFHLSMLRIFPTNDLVHDLNQALLQCFKQKGTLIFNIRAQDCLVNATQNTDHISMENKISANINKTGGLPKELSIFVGDKAMLRSNPDVLKGLVNGAIGSVTKIIWPHFCLAQMYATDIPSGGLWQRSP